MPDLRLRWGGKVKEERDTKYVDKDWYLYQTGDLRADTDKQREVFQQMLKALETTGACRRVFHDLAVVLYNESME